MAELGELAPSQRLVITRRAACLAGRVKYRGRAW